MFRAIEAGYLSEGRPLPPFLPKQCRIAGKCPGAPGYFGRIFSQEISSYFAGSLCNFCQNCVLQKLKFTTTMSRIVLLLNLLIVCRRFCMTHDLHRKFLFFDYAAGREIYFLAL